MKCKERCDEKTAPGKSRDTQQQQKKQDRIRGVQQDADFVVGRGVHAKELAVERVREPGERMVVCGVVGSECPFDGRPVKTRPNMRIARDVGVVVVVEKSVVGGGEIAEEDGGDQKQTENQSVFPGRE